MPLIHSRRWSLDRGASTYGYSRSWSRRSSVAEASLWRREAGRDYQRLASDGGRSWTKVESSSSFHSGGDTSYRSFGDTSVFGRRDRSYDDSLYKRNRSYDTFGSRDIDRRYGSNWRDTVYSKTTTHQRDDPPGDRNTSYSRDSTHTKTGSSFTDRTTLAKDIPPTRDSDYIRIDISQPKRDSGDGREAGKCKRVRFINIDSPEESQSVTQTSHLDTGTRRIHTQGTQEKDTHYEYGQISSTDPSSFSSSSLTLPVLFPLLM